MARTCPDCGKAVAENARSCMNCGCNLRWRRVRTWVLRVVGGVVLPIAIYGTVWLGMYLLAEGGATSNDIVGAYFECHRRAERRLPSPDGVDFPVENYENVSERRGENTYRFESFVDARYDTGPTRRYDYTCEVQHKGYDLWPLPGSGEPWRVHELRVTLRGTSPPGGS